MIQVECRGCQRTTTESQSGLCPSCLYEGALDAKWDRDNKGRVHIGYYGFKDGTPSTQIETTKTVTTSKGTYVLTRKKGGEWSITRRINLDALPVQRRVSRRWLGGE